MGREQKIRKIPFGLKSKNICVMHEWIAGFYLAIQKRAKIKISNIKEYMKKQIAKRI